MGDKWRVPLVVVLGLTLGPLALREARTQPVIQRASAMIFAHPDVIRPVVHGASISLGETTAAPTGQPNSGRIFTRDNGSGKTQLCVQFGTGIAQCFATEP